MDSSRQRVVQPYSTLPPAARAAVRAAWDDLLDAACEARRTGWRSYERDVILAEARRLGLVLWPAALDRLNREAARLVARP